MTRYDDLALVPGMVAKIVCETPSVSKYEQLRRQMTPANTQEFVTLADKKCRAAYKVKAEWFVRCVKRGEDGREALYTWISHWLEAYLQNPDHFRRECEG